MANYWLCVVIQRVALPLCLGISITFRPCGLSFLYLLLLLALPWVPVATPDTMKRCSSKFWKLLLMLVLMTAITHVVFHVTLLSLGPYGSILQPCENLEYILRQIGLVRLDDLDAGKTVRWVMPELITLVGGVLLYLSVTKLSQRGPADTNPLLPLDVEAGTGAAPGTDRIGSGDGAAQAILTSPHLNGGKEKEKSNEKLRRFLTQLGKYLLLEFLCIAGSMRPSVPSGVYFITFLAAATWWSCCRTLGRKFAISCRLLLAPLLMVHLIVLYGYQLQVIQDLLPPTSKWTRYFGITQLFVWDCNKPRYINTVEVEWASWVNPIALYCLYYIMILETQLLLKPQVQSRPIRTHRKTNETTPLIRGVSPARRYMKQTSTNPQDVLGTTPSNMAEDNIQMQDMNETSEEDSTLLEQIILAVVSIFQVIIMSSYIFTNIIMMTWSITYHSWMTFILLLWANVIWIVPNQRHNMLRSSPLLVFYAQFLLLAQYIYGMDLTEEELPSVISGINMAQIGFERPKSLPCGPLMIKSLFTVMFWITLRQMMQERKRAKRKSTIADMVAPLQLTVGAATSTMPKDEPEMKSKFMIKAGAVIKNIMTKFWIWVVAIMLFVSGVTGQRMTVFRIIYMSLFLIFMLTFQISWKVWRKIMYGFWLTVIIFSMCILCMVYTYQFDNFPDYWENYLKIPKKLQLDIGMEIYQTRELFIKLVTPTFFVIISVIQLHYFHKDFLSLSDMKRRTSSVGNRTQFSARSDASSAQGGPFSIYGSEPAETEEPISKGLERELSEDSLVIHAGVEKIKQIVFDAYELTFQALELHMVKIIMLSIMLMCIYEVNAMHVVFVILISLCQLFDSKWQVVVTKIISIVVSVLFISKMIYQIEYIEHSNYNVNCTDSNGKDHVYNTAKWIGFEKISSNVSLSSLLHGYIGIIVVTTLNAVITIRQRYNRFLSGKPQARPYYMFPGVTRVDADKDVRHCLKYLANFGYYKFGLEISLIATVGLICVRLDAYAIFYGIWLLLLFGLRRRMASRIWPAYVIFIVIVIPLQYCMVIGLPPSLCIPLPWGDSDILRRTQEFMFLADPTNPPVVHKLICDFILLVLVCRQQLVFRIEKRYNGVEYPGGSNSSIVKHAEEPAFMNPVPDYISDLRSWLDVVKRIVFMSFLWISLAIVFLAGSLRVNIFSLGYLIGSFYFLWQGTDLLLRPIPMIIKGWNGLLAFNVSVIVAKAALQIVGCIFIKEVEVHACWVIQLFGIGCIQKFSPEGSQFLDPSKCSVPREDIGLAWDGACFAFLILQRKIFKSFYFFHIINESKAMTMLASRGAELKEELQRKRVAEQEDEERNILEKIRQKMDRIKANQKRIQGPKFMEKQRKETTHCTDVLFGFESRPRYRKREPKTYLEAIRSGDYYMFDEFDDMEIDLEQHKSSVEEDEDEDVILPRRLTISEEEKSGEEMRVIMKPTIQRRTSAQYVPSEMEASITERTTTRTIRRDVFRWLRFIWAFVESLMVSVTLRLHVFSRDYRYVVKVLAREKILLKSKPNFGMGIRHGYSMIWTPLPHRASSIIHSEEHLASTSEIKPAVQIEGDGGSLKEQEKKSIEDVIEHAGESSTSALGVDFHLDDYERADLSSMDKPPFIRLVLSLWYLFLSHTDVACYCMIFLHQIKSANILSLPLPLMVFFWGTLSVPRPSKTFWVTLIAYTQTIVLIKCMFQFEFMPWNSSQLVLPNTPFSPQKIIGIQKKQYYATYDLLLLLVVFFHRGMLKYLGLWNLKQPEEYLEAGEYQMDIESKKTSPDAGALPKSKEHSKSKDDHGDPHISKLHSAPGMLDLFEAHDRESTGGDGGDSTGRSLDLSHSGSNTVTVHNVRGDPCDKFPGVLLMAAKKYTDSVRAFFEILLDPTLRVTTNVYATMFICDFYNFLVIIFGFSSFGQGNSSVIEYLEDNKVPIPFLVMIILQFMLILVDRALFLRKCIVGKIIFQYFLVLGVHIWMFFVLPAITERDFNASILPQMWYMVKSFYLLLSAYQIRCGYPTRILGNFLCKKYNVVNRFLFQAYMLVPWLFELRTIMDWIWTDTSMSMFDWLKMEDIFSTIFQLKCARTFEEQFPVARGMKKKWAIKCMMGGGAVLAIVMIMWFPLVFFAIGNTVGSPNIPYEVTAELRIGSLEPVFRAVAGREDIQQFNERQWQQLSNAYRRDRSAQTFLSNYEYRDASAVTFRSNSLTTWKVTPPDVDRLVEDINGNRTIRVTLRYTIRHSVNNPMHPLIIEVEKFVLLMDSHQRDNLASLLTGDAARAVTIKQLFPKFLKVANKGTATNIVQLMTDPATLHSPSNSDEAPPPSRTTTDEDEYESQLRNDEHGREYRDVLINLSGSTVGSNSTSTSPNNTSLTDSGASLPESKERWWSLREFCNQTETFYARVLSSIPFMNCTGYVMYFFNDKIFPAKLNFISGSGIAGIYVSMVFVAWRVSKNFTSGGISKIIYDELPNVDRVLQLCLDIYLVRESGDFVLEEDLYAKIVFLFRSPETLIKWSRPVEEAIDDEEASSRRPSL